MAHPDLDDLLNATVSFAQRMLIKHGEFYPFGATMDQEGFISSVTGTTGSDSPTSTEVIDVLIGAFREQAAKGEITAMAICIDVRAVPPGEEEAVDAICTRLEHRTGEAIEVFVPYTPEDDGSYVFGEMFAAHGKRRIFDIDPA